MSTILFNTTTIESWEIERHETLVRRARVLGGSLEGPGGVNIVIRKQEFPYDIGIFSNVVQSMGDTMNVSFLPPIHSFRRTHNLADNQLVLAIRLNPRPQFWMDIRDERIRRYAQPIQINILTKSIY
jgi:hypothetical protein